VQILSDNRFTLGVRAGERLNEHIVGDFPGVRKRHERFREALAIINLLWQGAVSVRATPRRRTGCCPPGR